MRPKLLPRRPRRAHTIRGLLADHRYYTTRSADSPENLLMGRQRNLLMGLSGSATGILALRWIVRGLRVPARTRGRD